MEFEYSLEDFDEIDLSVAEPNKTTPPAPIEEPDDTGSKVIDNNSEPTNEEALLNYWLEKGLIMVNPEEDEIDSIETALEIDNKRRTELLENQVKDYIVSSFPEDFKILAQAVLNEGITDIKTIISLYQDSVKEEVSQELDDNRAKMIVEKHYKDKLGYDQDLLDLTVETLITKNKLVDTAKQIEKVENSVREERRKIEMEKEIQRQADMRRQAEEQNQRYIDNINQQIESRSWNKNIKKEVQEDYLSGKTIEKIKDLLQNPQTAPDIAMLIHRLYQKDQGGNINLNLGAIKEIVSSDTLKELKNEQKKKAYNFRFGSLRKMADDADDMSEWEY